MAGLVQDVGHNEDIIGVIPYIRVHDYICKKADIEELVLNCDGFLPTIYIKLRMPHNTLNESNKLNDGELIQIGIRSDLKVFKSISVDFIVTKIFTSKQNIKENNSVINVYEIIGKLNVPYLETETIKFDYQGTAEEALMEIAKRVGLGYVENTANPKSPDKNVRNPSTKKEHWQCYSKPIDFIKDVTRHMWAGTDSFFDSWIDPYLNLVNVNVGDMLGRHVEDDGVLDETKFRSIIATAGADGKYAHNDLGTLDDYRDNKFLTNDKTLQSSIWFINSYHLENNSTVISKKESIQQDYAVYIQNNGLGQSENDAEHQVSVGVWYNPEKIALGYVTMNGPAKEDKVFKNAKNGSYKEQNLHYTIPEIMPIQSDGDEEIRDGGDNTQTSGNFSKEYLLAIDHNRLNLMELEKQVLYIHTTGFNNGIAKGEKIPVMIYRQTNEKIYNDKRELMDNTHIFDPICSGWFYVAGIEYTYKPTPNENSTSDWRTKLTLTRREWFPPEPTSTAAGAGDSKNALSGEGVTTGTTQLNDVTSGAKEVSNPTSTSETPSSETPATTTEMSGMADEVEGNQAGLEKNEDAINALDAVEDSEHALDDEAGIVDESEEKDENKCPVCGGTLHPDKDVDGKDIQECSECGWDSGKDVDAYKRHLEEEKAEEAARKADEEEKKKEKSFTVRIGGTDKWMITIINDETPQVENKLNMSLDTCDNVDDLKIKIEEYIKKKFSSNPTIKYDVLNIPKKAEPDDSPIAFSIKITNQNNKYWKVETTDSNGKKYSDFSKLYSQNQYSADDVDDDLVESIETKIKKTYSQATFSVDIQKTLNEAKVFNVKIDYQERNGFYTTSIYNADGSSSDEFRGTMLDPSKKEYNSDYLKNSTSSRIKKVYPNAIINFTVTDGAKAEDAKLAQS